MTPEKVQAIIDLIMEFDWSYEMSDDHSVYQRGSQAQAVIIRMIMELNRSELEALTAWWKSLSREDPYGFKRWVTDRLEHCGTMFALADPEHSHA